MFKEFKVERTSVSNTIADYIKSLIDEGKFKEGDKIPGEREMSQLLNVSRNSIREAYKILAAVGYLEIKHGNGVFITDDETKIRAITSSFFLKKDNITELFQIRKVLETSAIKWAIQNKDIETTEELKSLLSYLREHKNNSISIEELALLDQKFHLLITKMANNSVLIRIMTSLIDLLNESRLKSIHIPGRVDLSVQEHIKIAEAILEENVIKAKKQMLYHLESVEKSLLLNQGNEGQ